METHFSNTHWDGATGFDATVGNGTVHFDTQNGLTPKRILLNALAACSGYDVVSILEKMQVPIKSFDIEVAGHLTDEHPRYYQQMEMTYIIAIPEGNEDKMKRAVQLSIDKYCGVHAMFHQASNITFNIKFLPFN